MHNFTRAFIAVSLAIGVVLAQSETKLEVYQPAPLPETIKPNPIPKTMTDVPPGLSLSGSCLPSLKSLRIPSNVKGIKPNLAISKQIQAIADADQAIRKKGILNEKTNLEDQQRRIKLLSLIPKAVTAQDFANIALVFQHGDCTLLLIFANKMAGMAIDLAKNGTTFKYVNIRWLYAATLDRALEYATPSRAQKYGTQNFSLGNDCVRLYVVDPRTTDEERAEYNVASLKNLISENKAKEKPGCK